MYTYILVVVRAARPKLSTPRRREIILRSAHAVFTEKGFSGATTKELARVAGISEALLFRHFPTKEALYSAVQKSCCEHEDKGPIDKILNLEPSTSSLVFLLYHFFVRMALSERHREQGAGKSMPKLILQSLAGDGGFARHCHERGAAKIIAKLEECLQAAVEAGDAVEMPVKRHLRCWFSQHLAGMLAFNFRLFRQFFSRHAVRVAKRTGGTGGLVCLARIGAEGRSAQALLQPAGIVAVGRLNFFVA